MGGCSTRQRWSRRSKGCRSIIAGSWYWIRCSVHFVVISRHWHCIICDGWTRLSLVTSHQDLALKRKNVW
jgi:hypothetical protein